VSLRIKKNRPLLLMDARKERLTTLRKVRQIQYLEATKTLRRPRRLVVDWKLRRLRCHRIQDWLETTLSRKLVQTCDQMIPMLGKVTIELKIFMWRPRTNPSLLKSVFQTVGWKPLTLHLVKLTTTMPLAEKQRGLAPWWKIQRSLMSQTVIFWGTNRTGAIPQNMRTCRLRKASIRSRQFKNLCTISLHQRRNCQMDG